MRIKNTNHINIRYSFTVVSITICQKIVLYHILFSLAEGESLYIRYNTDANVVNNLKNDSSYKFIGEVILKINVV